MRRILQIFSVLALAAVGAHAAIVVAFDQPAQSGQWGDLLVFTGVISNTGPDTVFLNGDSFSGLSPEFTIIDQFFANVPISLGPGSDSGSIELFDVQVNNPPFGPFQGNYKLFGGVDGDAQDLLASADFEVTVVPEPSTFLLLAGALTPIAVRRSSKGRV